jgi:hypothetical protein
MKLLETDWWTLELPPEWEAEQDEDVIVIEDEDGVSCLELSTLVREQGAVSERDLAEFSRDLREAGHAPRAVRIGPWSGEVFEHDDDEYHWREWFLRHAGLFVYGAYHCESGNRGMDDAAIDEILATLEPRPS